jgi:hypothetical protein
VADKIEKIHAKIHAGAGFKPDRSSENIIFVERVLSERVDV